MRTENVLDHITPLLLTRNEAPNIARTLTRLGWARDIVVVDSHSDDETIDIASSFPAVRIVKHAFDSHAVQWQFGLHDTGISTEWVLALDADYVLSDELIEELAALRPDSSVAGYQASFKYAVGGRILWGSAYPPVTVLYRRDSAHYVQDGHTQRVVVSGRVENLAGSIVHDDRKSLEHWVSAQCRYMKLEAEKLAASPWRHLSWKSRVRKLRIVAPPAMFLYCLFARKGVLDGSAGVHYALQRAFSELLLSLYLTAPRRYRVAADGATEPMGVTETP